MKIETKHSRHFLIQHLIRNDFILPGQLWCSADGSDREVQVVEVKDDWVKYTWEENGEQRVHEKSCFAFQCRYCLVIDKESPNNG